MVLERVRQMVRGESNSVMKLPWSSKRVMFRAELERTCGLGEDPIRLSKSDDVTIKVVLAWLLRFGGIKIAAGSSPEIPERSTSPLEVKLLRAMKVATKEGLIERAGVAEELTERELLSKVLDGLGLPGSSLGRRDSLGRG